jgi:ATP-dependent DNA helicase RecG
MSYNITANPEQNNITITGEGLRAFSVVPGAQITPESAVLPFTQKTAEMLFDFLKKGQKAEMSLRTKAFLRVLKDNTHAGKKDWQWDYDLHNMRDIVVDPKGRKLKTAWDLIHYMPLRYIDKSSPQNITDLNLDTWSVVVGQITTLKYIARADAVIVEIRDITGAKVSSWFFRQQWLMRTYHEGDTVVLSGTYSSYTDKRTGVTEPRLTNATIDAVGKYDSGHKVVPVYSEKVGKKKWVITKEIEKLLTNIGWIIDPVPEAIVKKYNLMTRNEAYRKIHVPDSLEEAVRARERIAFDDFVRLQVFLHQKKNNEQETRQGNMMVDERWTNKFIESLPFEFTGAQKRVIGEIRDNMAGEKPMRRLLHGDVGSGKAQPLYSKILTPNGFTTMGEIKVGDTVLTPNGSSSKVVGLFPQGKRPVYELTFRDGTKVHADKDHLWAVKASGGSVVPKLLRTEEIAETVRQENGKPKWFVAYPIINGLGQEWSSNITPDTFGCLLTSKHWDEAKNADHVDELKRLGLGRVTSDNAFIPEELLNSDDVSRRILLESILKHNGTELNRDDYYALALNSTSETFVENVAYLVRSLGGAARVIVQNDSYTISGWLPREQGRTSKSITSVEYIGEIETQCIKIADPNGLYITDGFNVTHNTEVSLTAALRAVRSGFQVAMLAPTSILAVQLAERFERDIKKAGLEDQVSVGLLHTGVKVAAKRKLIEGAKTGELNILVGTHSILNKDIEFHKLGLIIIDEQHRFGTKHRQALTDNFMSKSSIVPDVLMMSATPIPRTMSQTIYGDMDLSVIDEYPADRKPVATFWDEDDSYAWDAIREEVTKGHQAYVIASLVDESESEKMENVENATQTQTFLQTSVFPDFKVGLVHGKMKPAEKSAVLEAFYANDIQVLVSTSVIEVGVNVPNATVMTILNANRFGIASLHQIRGRVGRGSAQGYCYLIGEASNPDAEERLNAMVASNDGFWLAEKDLEIRGEGSLLKDSQSGENDMIVANLREHKKLLEIARRVAKHAAKSPKMLDEVGFLFKDGEISS